ncbi:hypothetical protein Nepgr_022276 [Nepenthes gracilis]|uniref:Uncharacterized protein n=1 Tax=Nepenthes gracilis TaxID=150966 RepID=A0AAD3SZ97_NEPGR|nr:hypothetical protein Nepgr_022276 [Nepenthes gracilis]
MQSFYYQIVSTLEGIATAGNKSQGGTHILYDPTLSERGALVCVARAPRKKSVDDFEAKPVIHNPHALPLFRDQPSRKRQREKILKDPLKSHKPELPITGPGHGGRTGSTKGSLLTQYLLKQGGMLKETWMDEDPREAILNPNLFLQNRNRRKKNDMMVGLASDCFPLGRPSVGSSGCNRVSIRECLRNANGLV